jgi:aldehyde:ferredoxin oxidoreductase
LKYAGYDVIVVEGRSSKPVYLWINNGKAEIRDARDFWGKSTFEAGEQITDEVQDPQAEALVIGPAGENLVKFSSIITVGRLRGKAAARTGLGAVMGSKRLKAVVTRGTNDLEVARIDDFMRESEDLINKLMSDPKSQTYWMYGTTSIVSALGNNGALATWNYQKGIFDRMVDISGEVMKDRHFQKAEACFSCIHRCARNVKIEKGAFKGYSGKGPEFETISMVGSNLGIGDIDAVIAIGNILDEYGMDTISCGNVIGFAMECYQRGILSKEDLDQIDLKWGNVDAVLKLIKKIAMREKLGNVLAEGVKRASEVIQKGSHRYAMHVKSLEVIGGDPRGQKAFGLGYAVCSRGACHLGALPVFEYSGDGITGEKMFGSAEAGNRLGTKGKGRLVKLCEDIKVILDSLILCSNVYTGNPMGWTLDGYSRLYTFATGIEIDEKAMWFAAERIINLERAFNVREGITRKDDTLPKRFTCEPLTEGASAGHLVDLEPMLDEYYNARDWSIQTGIPHRKKLEKLGLQEVAKELHKLGKVK